MTTGCLEAHDPEVRLPRLAWRSESTHEDAAPPERCKHAATVAGDGSLFICGGRCGLQLLKDLWQYDAGTGSWRRMELNGSSDLPPLEGHSVVEYRGQLFVFGGTFGYPDACETPLWIYSLEFRLCRQWFPHGEVAVPSCRRGHSAVVHRDAMVVFGGFVDLRGSVAELWSFDFASESWHLTWSPGTHSSPGPSSRYGHSAVMHDWAMWVFGGMNDLAAKGDLWRWSFRINQWSRIKFSRGPTALANHCAVLVDNRMLVLGSNAACVSANSKPTAWAFSFDFYGWQDLSESVLPASLHICSGQTLHLLDFVPPPVPFPLPPASVSAVSLPSDDLCVVEDLETQESSTAPGYHRLVESDSQSGAWMVEHPSRWAFRNPALSVSSVDSSGDSGVELLLSLPSSSSSLRRSGDRTASVRDPSPNLPRRSMLVLVGCCKRRPLNPNLVLWCADLNCSSS